MIHHYKLKCQACHAELEDDSFTLKCQSKHEDALLTTHYACEQFDPDTSANDITRYRNWLPRISKRSGAVRTITYQSEALNKLTGLTNLWIAFNGYWPERNATLETATFKELEAYTVLSRLPKQSDKILVLASAGNAAAAFAYLCSLNKIRCLIVIPQSGLRRMVFSRPLEPCVKVVTVSGFSDYYDAIRLAESIAHYEICFNEGGVRNVGRRDGIGTTMFNAAETIGRLPDYYFQAIGSGTGGIAVHEAAKRLVVDGRFGRTLPRLMLSQNAPFAPMYHSWKAGKRELIAVEREEGKRQIEQITADVLSNQRPPYAVKGGVFDVLQESRGDMLIADNFEVLQAMKLFEDSEGIDIDPAGGVALATLLKAAKSSQIERDALILLHITGGGWRRHQLEEELCPIKPDLQVEEAALLTKETTKKIARLLD